MSAVMFGMVVMSLPIIMLGLTLFGIIFPNKLLPKIMRQGRISGGVFGLATGYTLTQVIAVFVFPYTGELFTRFLASLSSWAALWALIVFVLIPPENGRKKIVFGLGIVFVLAIVIFMMVGGK